MKICRKFGRLTTHVITPLFILFFTLLCGYTPAQANGVWVILDEDEVEFPPRFKAPTDFPRRHLTLPPCKIYWKAHRARRRDRPPA